MVHTLPPLEWTFSCGDCMSRALGCSVSTTVEATVNPLVYKVRWKFGEAQEGKQRALLWNLVQQWATKNESIPQGKVETSPTEFVAIIGTKRRLGPPRDASPLG